MARFLAVCHFAWGALLSLSATWAAISILGILPRMSSGAVWTNLVGTVLLAVTTVVPLAAIGAWMILLGRWLWSGHKRLRTALLWTHALLLAIGSIAVIVGIYSMEAAERSTARGGGLLSPVAFVPVLFGVPAVALAVCSIAVALTRIPRAEVDA